MTAFQATFKPLLTAALLAASLATSAQTATTAPVESPSATAPATQSAQRWHARTDRMATMDPAQRKARMEERRSAHLSRLKTLLQIDAAQEGAWATFTDAMKPPATMNEQGTAREQLAQLTTPERLDRLQAWRSEHAARQAKRSDAIRNLYAALTPAQQKAFDLVGVAHAHKERGRRGWHNSQDQPRQERDGHHGRRG